MNKYGKLRVFTYFLCREKSTRFTFFTKYSFDEQKTGANSSHNIVTKVAEELISQKILDRDHVSQYFSILCAAYSIHSLFTKFWKNKMI